MTYTYKLSIATLVATALLLGAGVATVSAQESFERPGGPNPGGERPPLLRLNNTIDARAEVRADLKERREDAAEMREEMKEKRDEFRTRELDTRAELRTDHMELQAEIRSERDAHRAEVKAQLDAAETEEERQAILEEARAERDAMREAALEKRAEFRARAATVRDELRENRVEFHAEVRTEAGTRIKGNLENILDRIGGALDKFVGLLERINNKIAELEANGVDTAAATAASAQAEVSIDTAADALARARAAFEVMLESETPRDHLEDVKTATRAAGEATKEAHRTLRGALDELKSLIRSINVGADASVEVDATVQ